MNETAVFLPKRAIGEFTATVTVEESTEHALEITEHPVEQGAEITDHAYKRATSARLHVMWNDDDAPLSETLQKLKDMQESRIPFDVITGKEALKNMLIKSMSVSTNNATENALDVTLELSEVNIVSVETVSVPEKSKQANPEKTQATQKAGKKQAKNTAPTSDSAQGSASGAAQSARRRSALAALAGKGE